MMICQSPTETKVSRLHQSGLRVNDCDSCCHAIDSNYFETKKNQQPLRTVDFKNDGGTCGGRTHDKRINSPLLYQLS